VSDPLDHLHMSRSTWLFLVKTFVPFYLVLSETHQESDMNSEAHKISVKRQNSLKLSRTFFLLCSVDKSYIRASLSGSRCSQPLSETVSDYTFGIFKLSDHCWIPYCFKLSDHCWIPYCFKLSDHCWIPYCFKLSVIIVEYPIVLN
jgi:hypothetical protein